ncbi:NAD(+) kinase [Microbulbifer sp. TRSA002]|uniref:NAD(+) kinase n=1 Tax=Microbulbifer sp. TRSA002 TaxID=3243382 RepID=UPI0040398207
MSEFKNIGLIGRTESVNAVTSLTRLMKFLEREGYSVVLEEEIAGAVRHSARVSAKEKLGELCDLVIVVGGDGSLLAAARALAKFSVPLLGINRGRLGFLTDITPDEVEQKVGDVLAGKYMAESRFLLDMSVTRSGKPVGKGTALNDVVLHPGEFIRMIEFDLYIDGQFVYTQRSDGLIISTPTGSTAYALSGGGPIMHPKLDAIVLVPLNPHTLSSRPIVVEGSSEFKIIVGEYNTTKPYVTCDGHEQIITKPGDVIRIHKKPHRLTLVHPLEHNFYEICRSKLGWAE